MDTRHHYFPQSECIVTFWAKEEGNCAVCEFFHMSSLICCFIEKCAWWGVKLVNCKDAPQMHCRLATVSMS